MYRDDRLTAPRHDLRGSGPQWEGSAWIVRWERAPWRWGKDGWRWTVSQERASCSGGDGRSGIFFFFFFFFAFRLDRVVGYFSEMITERPGDGGKGKRKESDREKRKRRRKEKEASSETRIKMDRSGRRGENQIMTEDELVMLDVVVW